ncbi:MAG: transposase [Rhodospirillales bacterium]|nr:MAG: transposase [Rhodospirillales bacterium]
MESRERLVRDWLRGDATVSELGRRHGVSRRTVYATLARYDAEGVAGLKERSHAARHHPNAMGEAVERRLVELRGERPTWGPKKLLAWLSAREPEVRWPGRSAAAAALSRHGLTAKRRTERSWRPQGDDLGTGERPNDVWCVDFKGWWRTRDARRLDPLSLSDHRSRYVLRLVAVERCDFATVRTVLSGAFREHGLPLSLRSDNGPPFAGRGWAGSGAWRCGWCGPGSGRSGSRRAGRSRTAGTSGCI